MDVVVRTSSFWSLGYSDSTKREIAEDVLHEMEEQPELTRVQAVTQVRERWIGARRETPGLELVKRITRGYPPIVKLLADREKNSP